MEHGAWGMEHGAWSMESGAWGMERGAWSMGYGAWGMGRGAWSMEHVAWSKKQGILATNVLSGSSLSKSLNNYTLHNTKEKFIPIFQKTNTTAISPAVIKASYQDAHPP